MKKLLKLFCGLALACGLALSFGALQVNQLAGFGAFHPSTGGGGPPSLLTGLVEFWKMDETSGTRAGSANGYDLTANGSVGNATGIGGSGTAASITGTTSLSRASESALQLGDFDFTYAGWVYFNSNPSGRYPVVLNKYATSNRQIYLYVEAGPVQFRLVASHDGTATPVAIYAANGGTIVSGTWYFVIVEFDATAELMKISVNNGTPNTQSLTGGVYSSGTAPLLFGIDTISGSGNLDGRLQRWGFWTRLLTAPEKATLYASGAGIDYPF